MQLSHHFWTLLLDGQLYLAPIKPPKVQILVQSQT